MDTKHSLYLVICNANSPFLHLALNQWIFDNQRYFFPYFLLFCQFVGQDLAQLLCILLQTENFYFLCLALNQCLNGVSLCVKKFYALTDELTDGQSEI